MKDNTLLPVDILFLLQEYTTYLPFHSLNKFWYTCVKRNPVYISQNVFNKLGFKKFFSMFADYSDIRIKSTYTREYYERQDITQIYEFNKLLKFTPITSLSINVGGSGFMTPNGNTIKNTTVKKLALFVTGRDNKSFKLAKYFTAVTHVTFIGKSNIWRNRFKVPNMINVCTLELIDIRLNDLSVLSNMPNIKRLCVTSVWDVSFTDNNLIERLEELYINSPSITLSGFNTNLVRFSVIFKEIDLSGTRFDKLEFLELRYADRHYGFHGVNHIGVIHAPRLKVLSVYGYFYCPVRDVALKCLHYHDDDIDYIKSYLTHIKSKFIILNKYATFGVEIFERLLKSSAVGIFVGKKNLRRICMNAY